MDRLLSDDELVDLTGYQQPSKQVEALRALGLMPIVRPDGRPRITFAALTAALTGALGKPVAQPNFAALRVAR